MTLSANNITRGFSTPESRWARFGPYYAMFPFEFAFDIVSKYSNEGDHIIDPFAGRGSSIFAGGILKRHSIGIEINPVGWLYGTAKLEPADKELVILRLKEIYKRRNYFSSAAKRMDTFFQMCFCDEVLKFLLSARHSLDWENNSTDATLMSILLVYLHGKIGQSFSNQMRMTKAMDANYSVDWWKKNNFNNPPEINPLEFLIQRINWRYSKGMPNVFDSRIFYGDSVDLLGDIAKKSKRKKQLFSLLFTSPPYYSVTDYHVDQWIRLWLLGGADKSVSEESKGRFTSQKKYYNLLDNVFGTCAEMMAKESTVYVRTDKREFTFDTTLEILKKHFPNHKIRRKNQPFMKKTQTEIHGNTSKCSGEVDIIMKR